MKTTGSILEISGVVADVLFDEDATPKIYDALIVEHDKEKIVLEVQAILGDGRVRTVAMGSTYGLKRGTEDTNTGESISVPVGEETLGRMFDVLGNPIDGKGEVKTKKRAQIHRKAPTLLDQSVKQEIFETGIKVIDLLTPFIKGGKIAIYGGAGVGKTVII